MRLLYVTADYPYGAPGESFLEPELAALSALGVQVDVLPVRRRGTPRRLPDGVRLRPETLSGSWRSSARPSLARHLPGLVGLAARSPRVLPRNVAVLPLAASVAGAVATEDGYDHIHAHWLSHTSTAALALSRLTGTPFSITAHRWDVFVENLFVRKAHDAAFIRFIAQACRRAFEAQVGPGTGRLVDLHMGVEHAEPAPVGRDAVRPAGPVRLVTAGNHAPVKGQQHLVDAIALLRGRGVPTTLDVFGEGPLRDRLAQQVADLGLADVVALRGVRPRAELAAAYARGDYDVYVMPSVDLGGGLHEGVPVALMEAMAAGVPAVATDTGGIPELVLDERTGLLVEHQSAEAIADAVQRLVADPALAARLAAAGARHVREEFDSATVARRLLDLMQG